MPSITEISIEELLINLYVTSLLITLLLGPYSLGTSKFCLITMFYKALILICTGFLTISASMLTFFIYKPGFYLNENPPCILFLFAWLHFISLLISMCTNCFINVTESSDFRSYKLHKILGKKLLQKCLLE